MYHLSVALVLLVGLLPATAHAAPVASFGGTTCGQIWAINQKPPVVTTSGDINRIEFTLDDASVQLGSKSVGIGQYSPLNWDLTKLNPGNHKLLARVFDNSGASAFATAACSTSYLAFVVQHGVFSATNNQLVSNVFSTNLELEPSGAGITKVEFYLNGALKFTNSHNKSTPDPAIYGFNWNTTLVPNGTYDWTAKIYSVNGQVGVARTYDNQNTLHLIVKNMESASQPPATNPTAEQPSTCTDRLVMMDKITQRVIKRMIQRADSLDMASLNTSAFLSKSGSKPANFNQLVNDIEAKQQATQANLESLQSDGNLNCDSALQPQVNTFRAAVMNMQTSLSDYRKAIVKLIEA